MIKQSTYLQQERNDSVTKAWLEENNKILIKEARCQGMHWNQMALNRAQSSLLGISYRKC